MPGVCWHWPEAAPATPPHRPSPAPPTPTVSGSPSSTTDAADAAIIAAYTSSWDAQTKAYSKASSTGTNLQKNTTFKALADIESDLVAIRKAGPSDHRQAGDPPEGHHRDPRQSPHSDGRRLCRHDELDAGQHGLEAKGVAAHDAAHHRRRGKIIADAVMYYTLIEAEQRTKLRAFVEVHRTTMSGERLASKLIEYARLPWAASTHGGPREPAACGCVGTRSSPASLLS
ncbi:hypothetical protein GCM10010278_65850 [Streptomyces melanogenes]|nr:hypothetical protein GCM10010278_65850 [Streptomyces melanogenes]